MSETRYTTTHEWARLDGTSVVVGVTAYAVKQMGDVVAVEMPLVDQVVGPNSSPAATIESVKAASEVFSPVNGVVGIVNENLLGDLNLFASDPEGKAWMFAVSPDAPGELDTLMTAAQYEAYVAGL